MRPFARPPTPLPATPLRPARPLPTAPLRPTDGPYAPVPVTATVLVRPEVLQTISAGVANAGRNETGGPFFGTVQHTWDGGRYRYVVALLGTLPPGPAVNGRPAAVGLGARSDGERAASALRWLRETTGLDLLHLGDWHRHPFGSPRPSDGDQHTAREMRELTPAPLWLMAIVVDEGASDRFSRADANVVTMTRSQRLDEQIHFYQECGPLGLVPVRVLLDSAKSPRLPPLPWHIADPARFAAECRLLLAGGFRPALEPVLPGARPVVLLRVERDGCGPLIVETALSHPHEEPLVRDAAGRHVQPRFAWSPQRFIVDLLREAS